MRVQGVDPIILNRIQEKVKKHTVQKSSQTYISTEQERRQKKRQGQEAVDAEKLGAAVERLNSTAEELGIDLAFFLDDQELVVLVVEKETQQIIRQLPPEKVHEMLLDMKSFVGMMVDYVL